MGVSTSCSALCALKEQPVKFRHVSLSELKTTRILVHGVCWESSPSLGGLSGAEHTGRGPSARFEQALQSSTAAILTKARGLELRVSRAELGDFGSAVADKSLIPCKSHTQATVQYHPLVGLTPATTQGQHSEVTHGGHHPGSLVYSEASECQ